jgi:hypothetical protein
MTLRAEPLRDVATDPGGQGRLVGALGGDHQHHAERPAELDRKLRIGACGLAVLRVGKQVLASSMMQTTGHRRSDRWAAICRVTLSGHTVRSRARSRSARFSTSARSRCKLSAAYPIEASSTPLTNLCATAGFVL